MGSITKTNVITIDGGNWWVDARKKGLYLHMLKIMLGQLFIMLEHHSKIFVVRFDLHQPTDTETNIRMTQFIRRLKKWLISKYGFNRVAYIWAREQKKGGRQHYHYALILDGHKVNYPEKVIQKATEIWYRMGGTNFKPKNCFYNISRGKRDTLQEAIYRISYLAKVNSKGNRSTQTKDYSTSRIKGKTNQC